jgi:hypothetical protein
VNLYRCQYPQILYSYLVLENMSLLLCHRYMTYAVKVLYSFLRKNYSLTEMVHKPPINIIGLNCDETKLNSMV